MTEPRVLALDVATTTGFAIGPLQPSRTAVEVAAGHVFARPVSGEKALPTGLGIGPTMARFVAWLHDLICVERPGIVVFEAPFVRGKDATRLLFGLSAAVEMVVADEQVSRVYEVDAPTVRKHFCANGRATKADVLAACAALGWDISGKRDNEADALAVYDYACAKLWRKRVAA